MDSYFSALMMDPFIINTQHLSSEVNWWTGVVWIIVMFLSDSHSDGTHSLLRHWCNATFLQIWWRNYIIYDLRVSTFSANVHIWVNYSFKCCNYSCLYDLLVNYSEVVVSDYVQQSGITLWYSSTAPFAEGHISDHRGECSFNWNIFCKIELRKWHGNAIFDWSPVYVLLYHISMLQHVKRMWI